MSSFNFNLHRTADCQLTPLQHGILVATHLAVIILSALLITLITLDTLNNVSFLSSPTYLEVQFWCCLVFLLDVAVEMWLSKRKWHYVVSHLLFIFISIPYLNILSHYHVEVTPHVAYLLKFIPMIRAAYVFAIVTAATTSTKLVNTMLSAYMMVLIVGVYFCSLTFFVAEKPVNPGVTDYWSALFWSIMSLTTAGCGIHAMTLTGRVLGVVLSATGLIFFPIFTVFLTNKMTIPTPAKVKKPAVKSVKPAKDASISDTKSSK